MLFNDAWSQKGHSASNRALSLHKIKDYQLYLPSEYLYKTHNLLSFLCVFIQSVPKRNGKGQKKISYILLFSNLVLQNQCQNMASQVVSPGADKIFGMVSQC